MKVETYHVKVDHRVGDLCKVFTVSTLHSGDVCSWEAPPI